MFGCVTYGIAIAYGVLGATMLLTAAIWICLIVVKEYRAAGGVK